MILFQRKIELFNPSVYIIDAKYTNGQHRFCSTFSKCLIKHKEEYLSKFGTVEQYDVYEGVAEIAVTPTKKIQSEYPF